MSDFDTEVTLAAFPRPWQPDDSAHHMLLDRIPLSDIADARGNILLRGVLPSQARLICAAVNAYVTGAERLDSTQRALCAVNLALDEWAAGLDSLIVPRLRDKIRACVRTRPNPGCQGEVAVDLLYPDGEPRPRSATARQMLHGIRMLLAEHGFMVYTEEDGFLLIASQKQHSL